MRITLAAFFAAVLTVSGSAQEFMANAGAPAVAFPNPDRPVAAIVSPIWHNEKERDVAGEPRQLVRPLGIKSGMTVADIGAGSGYYVVRLSPIVGPHGRVIAEDVVPEPGTAATASAVYKFPPTAARLGAKLYWRRTSVASRFVAFCFLSRRLAPGRTG